MIRISRPSAPLKARIFLPASKSISNRLLVIRFLLGHSLKIKNCSTAGDTVLLSSLLEVIRHNRDSSTQEILRIDARDAGTALRFLLAALAMTPGHYYLTGSARMKQRPAGPLVDALRELGADIEYLETSGFPPLRIRGRTLSGGNVSIDSSISSQFVSALMLIAPCLESGLDIYFQGRRASWPYVVMTIRLLQMCGVKVMEERNCIRIRPGKTVEQELEAEPDWSAASFWYAMLALSREGEVFFPGLQVSGLQADEQVQDLFLPLGVQTLIQEDGVLILRKKSIVPLIYRAEFGSCPDLALPVIVTCAALGIEGEFTGLERLAIKESDRLAVISRELAGMGRMLHRKEDAFCLEAGPVFEPKHMAIMDDNDHRVAMAFASLAVMGYEIDIRNADVVSKSYPGFWQDLRQAGFSVADYC